MIDLGVLLFDGLFGLLVFMKQNVYCIEVGVLFGIDFQLQLKYMEMLNLNEVWQFGCGDGVKVVVIDMGVILYFWLLCLVFGGDYVMVGGDGLLDCDVYGILVVLMIVVVLVNGVVLLLLVLCRLVIIFMIEMLLLLQMVIFLLVLLQIVIVILVLFFEEGVLLGVLVLGLELLLVFGLQLLVVDCGGGMVIVFSYFGGCKIVLIDNLCNLYLSVLLLVLGLLLDVFSGIVFGVEIIFICQLSQVFGFKDFYIGDEDLQMV